MAALDRGVRSRSAPSRRCRRDRRVQRTIGSERHGRASRRARDVPGPDGERPRSVRSGTARDPGRAHGRPRLLDHAGRGRTPDRQRRRQSAEHPGATGLAVDAHERDGGPRDPPPAARSRTRSKRIATTATVSAASEWTRLARCRARATSNWPPARTLLRRRRRCVSRRTSTSSRSGMAVRPGRRWASDQARRASSSAIFNRTPIVASWICRAARATLSSRPRSLEGRERS